MATYVNVDEMSKTLSDMLSHINQLKLHIDNYNTDASSSLGESSFRPTVESNLEGIKKSYQAIIPELQSMEQKINEVMEEYNLRASKIEGTGTGYEHNTSAHGTTNHEATQ